MFYIRNKINKRKERYKKNTLKESKLFSSKSILPQ